MTLTPPRDPDFRALFEAAPGLYLVLLPDAPRYTIVAVSDAYARATTTTRETILGRGLFEAFPDPPADNLGASLERVLSMRAPDVAPPKGGTSCGPHEGRCWSATNCPVLGHGGEVTYIIHALEDVTDRPRYLLGISEDITERRRLDEERQFLAEASVTLSASLDYEQTLATVIQLAVRRVADWSAIDVVEDGQLRRLRVASADAADAALCAVLEEMPRDRDRPYLTRSVVESGRPLIVENVTAEYLESVAQDREHLQSLRATGVTSFIGVPLVLREKSIGVLMFGSVRHRRVYGQGDLRWAEALADRAAMAIENARLYRASIQASQLRDQVLAVVAHDLRNPLSTILLQAEVLRSRGKSEREPEVIHRAATRMKCLIQDLLDISLVEAGKLPIEKARLSANDLVLEGVELHRVLASSVELRVEAAIGTSGTTAICGDRERLLQVFENLIGNAIKFTAPGGRITVGTTARPREVVFSVADDGCGIAPDALPHVFEQFWQATRGGRRGAGLGLPIVKGIVEAHGGHIWVISTPGRGTTFYFSIPTDDREPDRPSPVLH
jgi:signal transduction histidine kinase